jgi:hypothetical protein
MGYKRSNQLSFLEWLLALAGFDSLSGSLRSLLIDMFGYVRCKVVPIRSSVLLKSG